LKKTVSSDKVFCSDYIRDFIQEQGGSTPDSS